MFQAEEQKQEETQEVEVDLRQNGRKLAPAKSTNMQNSELSFLHNHLNASIVMLCWCV